MTVAMHPRFVTVHAECLFDIMLVRIENRIYYNFVERLTKEHQQEEYCNKIFKQETMFSRCEGSAHPTAFKINTGKIIFCLRRS